jgi:hypothetical protein
MIHKYSFVFVKKYYFLTVIISKKVPAKPDTFLREGRKNRIADQVRNDAALRLRVGSASSFAKANARLNDGTLIPDL